MQDLALLVGLSLAVWVVLTAVATWLLRRTSNWRRRAWQLAAASAGAGALIALRGSGDDPIPAYLAGQMIGSALVFLVPVAVAAAIELRRRRAPSVHQAQFEVHRRFSRVAMAGAALIALALAAWYAHRVGAASPFLEVINTAPAVQHVLVTTADSDILWRDSIMSGSSECWVIPDYARSILAQVYIAPRQSVDDRPFSAAWSDSLMLRKGTRLHVHPPTFAEASPEWRRAQAHRDSAADKAFRVYLRRYVAGETRIRPDQVSAVVEDIRRDPAPHDAGAPRYVPRVSRSSVGKCAGT